MIKLSIKTPNATKANVLNKTEKKIETRKKGKKNEKRTQDEKVTPQLTAKATLDVAIVQKVKEKTFQFNPIMRRCRTFHRVHENETIVYANATCKKASHTSQLIQILLYSGFLFVVAFNKWKNIGFQMDSSNQHQFKSIL